MVAAGAARLQQLAQRRAGLAWWFVGALWVLALLGAATGHWRLRAFGLTHHRDVAFGFQGSHEVRSLHQRIFDDDDPKTRRRSQVHDRRPSNRSSTASRPVSSNALLMM